MAGRIPESFIDDLLARVDIVDVVGARVQLRKSGRNHKGLCPFHNEKTPSFNVNEDRQTFHCFGCEAHGTAIGFLMEYDNLTFPESIETLAAMAGMEVPREAGRGEKVDTGLYDVLKEAAARFREWLRAAEAEDAVAYLRQRGLSGEIARDYGLGVAPPGWDRLKTALAAQGEDRLVEAGLLVRNERGRTYDRFRERIVFPIHDSRGRVLGFGGRVYGDGEPKYINSPETAVFRKGRELYGLYEARRATRGLASVVVVEGYLDVIALAQHGVGNAVATLGTAIGQAHFDALYRHVDDVVCCFDGDEAGRTAAWKAVGAAFPVLSGTRQLRFVFLPEGEDPDTIVRTRGGGHFAALVEDAVPVGEYFLDHLGTGRDLDQADARAALAELAVLDIRKLPAGALRQVLLDGLSDRTRIDVAVLQRAATGATTPDPGRQAPAKRLPLSSRAERLLHWLVKHPELAECLTPDDRAELGQDADGGLLVEVVRYLMDEPRTDTGTLLARFVGQDAHGELARLAARPLTLPLAALTGDFQTGVRRYLQQRRRTLSSRDAMARASLEDLQRHADATRQHVL